MVFSPTPRSSDTFALVSLVISNAVLLVLAVTYQWSYYVPLLVFWVEIIIVGLYNVLKMFIVALAGDEPLGRWIGFENGCSALLFTVMIIFFFAVKFGGFILGVGFLTLLLPALFNQEAGGFAVLDALDETGPSISIGIILLVISHGVSFLRNFIAEKEYERANLIVLLVWPYVRALCLYGTILAGALVALALPFLDRSVGFAVGLVLVKIVADLSLHRREHSRFGHSGDGGSEQPG